MWTLSVGRKRESGRGCSEKRRLIVCGVLQQKWKHAHVRYETQTTAIMDTRPMNKTCTRGSNRDVGRMTIKPGQLEERNIDIHMRNVVE